MSFYFKFDAERQLESTLYDDDIYCEIVTGVDFNTGNKLQIKVYADRTASMLVTLVTPSDKVIYSYEGPDAEELLGYLKNAEMLAGYGYDMVSYLEQLNYTLAIPS